MDVKNKNVTVVGMGLTSMALVRLLLREGAVPFLTDMSNGTAIQSFKEELEASGVRYECGGHGDEAFARCDVVIPSPGVPPTIEPIRRAIDGGAELIGELDFAFGFCRSKIIAVTGTNGKTTTTELLGKMIEVCGHSVLLAGNNAFPFSAAVMQEPAPEFIVLEVSSYQLEISRKFHPWIGVVLNISEDHLERHGTLEAYAAAKANLFAYQNVDEYAILNADDPRCNALVEDGRDRLWHFSCGHSVESGLWLDGETVRAGDEAVADQSDISLPGKHNLQNALAALSVMRAGGFDWASALQGLRAFEGVEHRLEPVAEIVGVRYINDSKSTNIDSLKVALECFNESLVLIAGGRGKGADYAPLKDLVAARVSTLVLIGEDAPLMEETFGESVPTLRALDMEDAVAKATAAAMPGGIVLLSPACGSFDMYQNFEERGRAFKNTVHALENEEAAASRRSA